MGRDNNLKELGELLTKVRSIESAIKAIEHKVSAVQSLVVEIKTPSVKEKPINYKDIAKLIGTTIILFCWGLENYNIKPKESEKVQRQYDRAINMIIDINAQLSQTGMLFSAYLKNKDSSRDASDLALRSMYDAANYANRRALLMSELILPDEKYNSQWQAEQHNRFELDRKQIRKLLDANDYDSLEKLYVEIADLDIPLQEKIKEFNKAWLDITYEVRSERRWWGYGYFIGSCFLIFSLWPDFKKKQSK